MAGNEVVGGWILYLIRVSHDKYDEGLSPRAPCALGGGGAGECSPNCNIVKVNVMVSSSNL
jgi:hypothetical protein